MTAPQRPPRDPGVTQDASPEPTSAARECPVCQVSLEGRDPYGHSLVHFSDTPIPNRPETLAARKLQAELLGREAPKE